MSTLAFKDFNKNLAKSVDFKELKNMQNESNSVFSKSEVELEGNSLFIFSKTNCIRRYDKKVVESPLFDYFILIVILISSITLAIENPLNDPNSQLSKNLEIFNITMTIIFVIEFFMKVIANGFLFSGKESYLRNSWNVIDFFIVIISVFSVVQGTDLSVFKVIRVLRLLKPLRVIQRNEGLKIAVQALLMAVPNILYVSLVALLFFAIFGMTGVNMFKGMFFSCRGIDDKPHFKYVDNEYDCYNSGGIWMNADSHFDNIIYASRTLFEMSTTEGWVEIMNHGVDSRGIGLQPK